MDLHVTRCFERAKFKVQCDGEIDKDTGEMISEIEISGRDGNNRKYSYGYGRAIEGPLCSEHLTQIKKILKNSKSVCVTGDAENFVDKNGVYARWVSLETRYGRVFR